MSHSPLISIIVPVYKIKEEYIRICVVSLLRQTYENFEVILVDDGSPDDCGQICDECAALDERITVIHQANAGVSAARNAGLDRAKGQYIVFADPDDYLEDMFLDKMLAQMSDDVQIISCCTQVIGDDFTDTDHFFSGNRIFTDHENDTDDYATFIKCPKKDLYLQLMNTRYAQPQKVYTAIGVPWGKIYRADFLQKHRLRFDKGLPRMQDNLFNMYAFHAARKIVYIDEPLYDYRYEHMQQFSTAKNRAYMDAFYAVCAARQQCMLCTGLMEDSELRKAYQDEVFGFLLSISYKSIFHSANGYSLAKKKEEWRELIGRPVYQDLQDGFRPQSEKHRIYLFMMKHRCFLLMNFAMHRKEWKENISSL